MKYCSDGMPLKELKERCRSFAEIHLDDGIYAVKREMIPFILHNAVLWAEEDTRFFGNIDCADASWIMRNEFWTKRGIAVLDNPALDPYREGEGSPSEAFGGGHDYNHTAPDWKNVLRLGIVGLRDRAEKMLASKRAWTDRERSFFDLVVSHYDAAFDMIDRMAELYREIGATDPELLPGLEAIKTRAPKTLYEAMQTIIVYYSLQLFVDSNPPRTLGRLDSLLYPYYEEDIKSGRLTKESAEKLTYDFLKRLSDFNIGANLPFAICGDYFGTDLSNEYTGVILEQFILLASPNLKMHFLYSDKTPNKYVLTALDGIAKGSNSIVFMNDAVVKNALERLGAERADAEYYSVVGCYESGANGEVTCSCNGMINLGKVIEAAINGGVDMKFGNKIGASTPTEFNSFEEFYEAVKTQLAFFAKGAMAFVTAKESSYPIVNTGAYLASTYDSCMESGKDVYADFGAKYSNSSINAMGIATAADSVYALKKLVFDDKRLTFAELRELLENDWQGNELLRLTVWNKFPRYGQNDDEVDGFARDILKTLGGEINGKPNAKGGVYRLGAFSIDWRFRHGKNTAATPDGRRSGDPLSKNLGANLGGDKSGATAHMLSVSKIDGNDIPNGSVLDIVLHETAVRGEKGREIMATALKTFMQRGGFAVHYNVLSPDTLRDAQANPEKYPNLQVRLCGWNALFANLSKFEQDEFIGKAESAQ